MRTLVAVAAAALLSVACSESARAPAEPLATANRLASSSAALPHHGPKFVDISAGTFHTCVLRVDGRVYCWGGDAVGQIGIAATGTCGLATGTGEPCVPAPTRVTATSVVGGRTVRFHVASTVSAGSMHTCALAAGRAWCWGAGSVGQTGVAGAGAFVATPTLASTSARFTALDAGGNVTCALNPASSLYCWGERYSHVSLGTTPTLYAQLARLGIRVDVDQTNGCVQTVRRDWRCFGQNDHGELAIDPAVLTESVPLIATTLTATARRVTTSNHFMCADLADGTVSCVGNNHDLQLGGPTVTLPHETYVPVIVGGGMRLHGAAAGGNHVCALDDDSHAWCWGENTNYELGNGGGGNTDVPQAVLGGIRFRRLAAGASHTCGIAVDNTIYCWGANRHGELGDPAYTFGRSPTPHATAAPKG